MICYCLFSFADSFGGEYNKNKTISPKKIFEYNFTGGVPGDNRIQRTLILYEDGSCKLKNENKEEKLEISKEMVNEIVEIGRKIINGNEKKFSFLPDSTISSIKIYNGKNKIEISFYADKDLEAMFPEQSRTMQYIFLEEKLEKIIEQCHSQKLNPCCCGSQKLDPG